MPVTTRGWSPARSSVSTQAWRCLVRRPIAWRSPWLCHLLSCWLCVASSLGAGAGPRVGPGWYVHPEQDGPSNALRQARAPGCGGPLPSFESRVPMRGGCPASAGHGDGSSSRHVQLFEELLVRSWRRLLCRLIEHSSFQPHNLLVGILLSIYIRVYTLK